MILVSKSGNSLVNSENVFSYSIIEKEEFQKYFIFASANNRTPDAYGTCLGIYDDYASAKKALQSLLSALTSVKHTNQPSYQVE